jgi:hypothetical protein
MVVLWHYHLQSHFGTPRLKMYCGVLGRTLVQESKDWFSKTTLAPFPSIFRDAVRAVKIFGAS